MRHALFVAIAVVGSLIVPVAAGAQPGDITVDDDGAQCATAITSIEAGVEAADPGQTVWVCPGTYNETVTIEEDDAGITIRGVHYGDAGQRCQNPMAMPDPTLDSILQAPMTEDARGFDVQAEGVTITGFIVRGATMGTGIYTSPDHSGYRLDKNVIEDNALGIELHSDGDQFSIVTQNCIREQMGMDMMDMRMGIGILSHEGLEDASIENNRFAENMSAAIDLSEEEDDEDDGEVVTDVTIQRNESRGDNSFVRVSDSQDTTIINNTVSDFGGMMSMSGGIVIEDDNVNPLVTNNTLRDGSGPALQLVFEDDEMDNDDEPSENVRFERNTAEAAEHGVELEPESAVGATVLQNHIIDSTSDGLIVREDNEDNTVRQNHVRTSGDDGIHFESGTSGNQIVQNSSFGNGGSDCHDSGANDWEKNQGETSSGSAQCTPNGGSP